MKKSLLFLMAILAFSIAITAQTWTSVNSNLPSGDGVGQISVGMNNNNALWAYGIDNTGLIKDVFTKSTDGGLTWTSGTFNAGTGLSQLFAIDENTCWAMFNTGATQGLYKTTNGGTTWAKQGTAYGSASFADAMCFLNNNDGVAIGDPNGGYFEIYTSPDGGTTWTRVPTGNIPTPLSGEYGITGDYSSFGGCVWFGTNQGRIFHSIDKGLNWTVTSTSYGTTQTVQPVFADSLHGMVFLSYLNVGVDTSVNITTDGGTTWQDVTVVGTMDGRYVTHIPGTTATYVGSTGFAGGDLGVSYSYDGGTHWTVVTSGGDYDATAWLSVTKGWAGSTAAAKKTTGGMFIYTGDSLVPMAPRFRSDVHAVALGGTVHFTDLSVGFPTFTNWTFQGGIPATYTGTTPPAITYNTPGGFYVKMIVTNDWTSDTLIMPDYIYVGGVGINELNQNSLTIFPNPVKDLMTLQATTNINEIKLYNITGQLVLAQTVNANKIAINTSSLNAGIYSLKAILDNGTVTKKVVIQ
jgi:photosystem II stability/assembly factor-like uncharacterized protein